MVAHHAAAVGANVVKHMNRYLFLDIDGVLNNHTYNQEAQSCSLRKRNINEFNKIITKYPTIKVVLHSAWRYMILKRAMTLNGFSYMLRTHGVSNKLNLVGITCSDEKVAKRENQIYRFLFANTVNKYVILDDLFLNFHDLKHNDQLIQPHFIKTHPSKGLVKTDVDLIIKKLK